MNLHALLNKRWPGYLLAVLFTSTAALLRWAFPIALTGTPYLAFYPAVVASAAFGGLGPGILSTVASFLCVDLLFDATPSLIDLTDPVVLGRMVFFFAGGIGASLVAENLRATRAKERLQARKLDELVTELDQRVRARTLELEITNKELEAFCYSVSHDLRAPLRGVDGFSRALLDAYCEKIDDRGRDWLDRIRTGCQRMGQLIDDLLGLSRLTRAAMHCQKVDLTAMAQEIAEELRESAPQRQVKFHIAEGLITVGDPQLLRPALQNLLGNAWKFTAKREEAVIELGRTAWPPNSDPFAPHQGRRGPPQTVYFVRDNGAGFDMAYTDKLFGPFQRLHSVNDFPGTGIGLALVQRVLHRHGGKIWAEAAVNQGATFFFTLNEQGVSHEQ